LNSSEIPADATGVNLKIDLPAGTAFVVPSNILGVQALIVIGIVSVFFAACFGVVDIRYV
jgi:hypothetical protein